MRKLTIKRTKSFVGCLAKLKIYVEDPVSGDLSINNTLCRKIGELKNGEEKTFDIDEQPLKVFAIADKLSKDYCYDCYQLPEGADDVFLSGKPRYNPASGNAFKFDNNEGREVSENRKAGTKKGAIVMVVSIAIGVVIGLLLYRGIFSKGSDKAKTFSYDGMSITLTEAFREAEYENMSAAYESKYVIVFVLKEPFTLLEGLEDLTLNEYADLLIQGNGLNAQKKTVGENVMWEYDFTNPDDNKTYRYDSYAFKTKDAFWLIQFAAVKNYSERNSKTISGWAKSVSFS